jgi:hypothetical protein
MNDLLPVLNNFAASCKGGKFFDFPTWYKYLPGINGPNGCAPALTGINDVWLIVLAVAEILLRVAIFVAIVYIIIGGFKYINSRANPDRTAEAKNTVFDALIGLLIAVAATAIINFIARSFN